MTFFAVQPVSPLVPGTRGDTGSTVLAGALP